MSTPNLSPTEKSEDHQSRLIMRYVWDGYGWEDIAIKTGIHAHTITRVIGKARKAGLLRPHNFKPLSR